MNDSFLITKIERIIFVDKDEYNEKSTRFTGELNSNELIFHISGKSKVRFNGTSMEIIPNIIRYLPKGKIKEYNVSREENGSCIDIFFQTDRPVSETAFVYNSQTNKSFSALFNKIFSVWVAKDGGYYFECMSLLYKIFSEMEKVNYIPEKTFALIKPAIDYINHNFLNEKITAEKLRELCGISYSYINRLFIQKFSIPPKKYAIQMRMNFACDLLLTNMYTVFQVAEKCGYSDIYYFSRQFKEYLGVSPSKFLHKYKSSK